MQKVEYTCDWCHRQMPAERANRLSVQPVFVPMDRQAVLSGGDEAKPLAQAERLMNAMKEREKECGARSVAADICVSCFAELRSWIDTRMCR